MLLLIFSTAYLQGIEQKTKLTTGLMIDSNIYQIRFFYETKEIPKSFSELSAKTWSIQFNPFNIITLHIGSLSFSGIWSRFNKPQPNTISPIKLPLSIQQRLITSLPSKDTAKRNTSISLDFDFSFLKLTALTSSFLSQEQFLGLGLSIPFNLKNVHINGNYTVAWKMATLQAKANDSWFMKTSYFPSKTFHAIINELSFKSQINSMILSVGFSERPKGNPASFLRMEHSLILKPFLLNSQIFLCDLNYLTHTNSSIRDTVHISLNPQINFLYFTGLIRSLKLGITITTGLENGESFFDKSTLLSSFSAASELKLIFASFITSASFSAVPFELYKAKPIFFPDKNTAFKLQAKINYYPWYLDIIKREWKLQAQYKTLPLKNDYTGDVTINTSLSIDLVSPFTKQTEITVLGEANYNLAKKNAPIPMTFGLKIFLALEAEAFSQKQEINISAQTDIDVRENIVQKIESSISAIVKL